MEGKAPTEQLRSIFEQFKRWLSAIYNRVAASSRFSKLKISPDIREVFDNLVKGGEVFHKTEELSALDEEYIAAVDSGDVETQQRLVDEAAKAAGYNVERLYHGSRTP